MTSDEEDAKQISGSNSGPMTSCKVLLDERVVGENGQLAHNALIGESVGVDVGETTPLFTIEQHELIGEFTKLGNVGARSSKDNGVPGLFQLRRDTVVCTLSTIEIVVSQSQLEFPSLRKPLKRCFYFSMCEREHVWVFFFSSFFFFCSPLKQFVANARCGFGTRHFVFVFSNQLL
jgi:hypothetical protein